MSKGFKSTEFWLSLAGFAAGVYLAIQGTVSDAVTLATLAGPPGLYALSRGIAKHGKAGQ